MWCAPVDVCVDHGIGQQHVVDDFPEFINAGMRQGLVAAELDAPDRDREYAAAAGTAVAAGSAWPATGPTLAPKVT